MTTQTISTRLQELLKAKTDEYRRFKTLEGLTGIPSDTWKSWFHGRQRPTAEMIEAVCKLWPEYAFWLVTGISDLKHGHTQPDAQTRRARTAARDYFVACIELTTWTEANNFTKEDVDRYLESVKGNGSVDSNTASKLKKWVDLVRKVDELDEIRQEQETSLEKFEIDQENESGLPL